MPSVELTYARILEIVQHGDDTFYRIAVQTPTGEYEPGLIKNTGFATAGGLIVGMLLNGEFLPISGSPGESGGGNEIFGTIIGARPTVEPGLISIYPFEYTVRIPSPDDDPVSVVAYNRAETVEYANFQMVPIANGVGVIIFPSPNNPWYQFAMSNIEGACL
jgi:hypothetical protein